MHINFGKITVQKDRYKLRSGHEVGPEQFLEASDMDAELLAFKRIVVEGTIDWSGHQGTFTMVLHLRGNVGTLVAKDAAPHAETILAALHRARLEFTHHERPTGFDAIPAKDHSKVVVFNLDDALWFADIIHVIRDHGGFTTDVSATAFKLGRPN